ncbi:catalase [Actinosynnema sp. NPDC050436]|uniref:catalase n=1 Tax=Actinosynnema sp. NPDC050436 TaxID=3155659 RepID=UPI0033D3D124
MNAKNPAEIVKNALEKAVEKVSDLLEPAIPGAPSSEPPALVPPTDPRDPLPPKPDQDGPETVSPTGAASGVDKSVPAQQGAFLTTAQGVRLYDTDHSLKAGERGPTLLQDHHLREKIMHFDHERIPERVVHARGAGAHGVFVAYGAAEGICKAGFLREGKSTPVFVRFSTVVGSRGSADTVRDTRGFATKFYTDEGTFDLVGNNIPVFFIQDGIKFPDIIHAAKPHPDREIPQAQSAHDTFWDFVSQHTEATHHVLWHVSDRGVPRSYRTMEGFGVHTFRVVNDAGETSLVKFHWKPKLGVHSLLWEEAQMLSGFDPDFHRRDLYDAIESGAFPQWEFGVQVFPDTPDQTFEGIDLLDSTKIVPEELAPVQPVGMLTLNRNPTNFFAESEQVAFHTGHLVPGIDVTDDPLLHARLFSYLDTQLTRLGGPNFGQIPINRPHAPVNDMLRDGFHQHAVHRGVAPYKPNTLDGGCPFHAGAADNAYIEVPQRVVEATKVRRAAASFDDHFTQPRLFFRSLSPIEQDHVVRALTFELGKCYEQAIKERQLTVLARVDTDLAAAVAAGLGLPAPDPVELPEVAPSPALSQLGHTWPVAGRMVGIVVDADDPDGLDGVRAVRDALFAADVVPLVIAARGGELGHGLVAQRTFATARSVEFDAVLLAAAPPPAPDAPLPRQAAASPLDPRVELLVGEAYRHGKAVGAWGAGAAAAGTGPGVVTGDSPTDVAQQVLTLLGEHRVWDRLS